MKKSACLIAIISLAISACTTQKQATSFVNDDVYSPGSKQEMQRPVAIQQSNNGAQVITSPDNLKTQKPGSSTFEQDYNDYSYSNRIDRFSSKDTTKGYFDESYTGGSNSSNTGNSDPNVNISFGIGGGYGGFYGSSMMFGMGWGYPYSNWGWDYGWGYPYYGWGYPYYGWGYNPWYNPCCYCYGYNDWYNGGYPPYYTSNTFYGARKSLYRTDGGTSAPGSRNSSGISGNQANPGSRNDLSPAYSRNSITTAPRNVQSSPRSVPANQAQYKYTRTGNTQGAYQRTPKQVQRQGQGQTRSQTSSPRYVRPENAGSVQRSGTAQSYSSPAYRQPKSSQEYLTPRSQDPGSSRVTNQSGSDRNNVRTSGNGNRVYTSPSGGNRTYSSPTRSNSTNSIPTRSGNSGSYSPPVRSNNSGSYSAPSNSGNSGSYSAPSRSGGSGGSSPSGGSGSSGGGGRRR